MFKRKIAKDPKQYGPKKEKGMSTSYQRLPKSENYKENSTSVVHRSREETLKEMEKIQCKNSSRIKLKLSPLRSKALPGNTIILSLRKTQSI